MKKTLIMITASLSLAGCITSPIQSDQPIDKSYYVLDLKDYQLCRGLSQECRTLNSIIVDSRFARAIEESFQQKIQGPNYRASLARMLLSPANQSYRAEPLSSDNRLHKLPINTHTDTVWETLSELEKRSSKGY